MATHGAALEPNGNGLHRKLARLLERHGVDRVIATFEEMAGAGEATEPGQFVLGADNRLNPIPQAPRKPAESPEARDLRAMQERQEARRQAKETIQ